VISPSVIHARLWRWKIQSYFLGTSMAVFNFLGVSTFCTYCKILICLVCIVASFKLSCV